MEARLARDLEGWTVAFDLDGTLVDTAPDLLRALAHVMDREGLPTPPMERMRLMVGQGARALIERAARDQGRTYPDARLEQLTEDFVAFYAADIARESQPFPGVVGALQELHSAGAALTVCTNKRTALSVQLLDALDLSRHFRAIVGADAALHRKPHPVHLTTAVEKAGGNPRLALMVGDSIADVAAARAANIPCIAVRFGYCEEGVETLGADALLDAYDELGPVVRRLARR